MAEEGQYQDQTLAAEENKIRRSLSLKLKIPTKAADQYMEAEEDQQQRGVLKTCCECGKQFTSGKALGGHKRACLQKIKNPKNNNNSGITGKKTKIKNVVDVKLEGDSDQENNNICYVCHQRFRSVKSLYGHMRKHPEREWRGVQPPKRLLMNQNDYGDGDGVESFKGWSAKRKRGRRLIMSLSSSSLEEEEAAMQHAVNDLLLLAQLSANDCAEKVIEEDQVDDDGEKMRGTLGFDAEPMVTYSCTICNKAFHKHQPLGGHIASHNKNKNVKESSAEDTKAELQAAAADEASRVAAAGAGSSEHKCNKAFPTGQALGGDKRCHWIGPAEAFSSSTSAGEVTPRVVHDFDLNDTPPEHYYHFQFF